MTPEPDVERELEERIRLLETPGTGEDYLPELPRTDLVIVVVGLVIISILLLWWSL